MQPTISLSKSFRSLLALCLTGLLIVQLFLPVQGVRAATTWTVNSLDGSGDGICDAHCSLSDAVGASSSGDSIDFAPALSGTIFLEPPLYFFDGKTLTIHGNPQVNISGGGTMMLFWINPGTNLTLDGVTIQDGYSNGQGGAIYNESSTLTLTNSTIKNSSADGDGGAIYSLNGTLNILGSTLQDNTAGDLGGAISVYGGTLTVMNSTFEHNTSTNTGGGIDNGEGSLLVANSTFKNNSSFSGGAIEISGGSTTISNSTFIDNSAANEFGGFGGGIEIWTGLVAVTNSTFSGNFAWGGGAIYQGDMLTLINSTFSGNSASTDAGAGGADIYNDGTLNFANSILANPVSGGDCVVHGSGTVGTNTNNLVEDGSCSAGLTGDPMLAGLADNGGPTQTMALLPGSPAIDAGDGTICAAAPVNNLDQRGVIRPQGTHCDIGAYEVNTLYAIPTGLTSGNCDSWVNACELRYALATRSVSGQEIWVAAGTYKPTSSTDRTATFQLKNGVALYGGFAGTETARGQRNPAANLTILSGDIGAEGDTSDNSYHVVTGISGAILDGFTITGGNANSGSCPGTACGGGMYNNSGSSPVVTGVTFSGNAANYYGGGMVNNSSSSPKLTGVTFSGNTARTNGGGMANYSNSSPELTNAIFSGNSADQNGGGMFNSASSPKLTGVIFSSNMSGGNGGGMANYSTSSPELTNVTFSGNTATNGGGGGMLNYSNSSPKLTGVTFSANTAYTVLYGVGGGMSNQYSSSPELTNVTFSGNTAWNAGGMYNFTSCSSKLTNVTFSGNSATAGYVDGMYNYSSIPTIRNSIFWGNPALDHAQIYNESSIPVVSDSVVRDGYPGGTNIITTDPMLGTLGNYGGPTQTIPLLPGSSAIDAGNDTLCAAAVGSPDYGAGGLDQRGIARPQGAHCDIGAYEAQLVSLPLVTGWNLVSFNLHPVDTSIASVLASLGDQYSLVYAWDAGTSAWRIYDPTLGGLNDLETLDESLGFWIKMNSGRNLVVSGSVPGSTSIPLKIGWNLVGYPSAVNGTLPNVLSDHGVGTDFSLVYAYHASDGSTAWKLFDRLGNPLLNDLTELAPGWGYWIKASADHAWSVP